VVKIEAEKSAVGTPTSDAGAGIQNPEKAECGGRVSKWIKLWRRRWRCRPASIANHAKSERLWFEVTGDSICVPKMKGASIKGHLFPNIHAFLPR
jgi:hypothetical protein